MRILLCYPSPGRVGGTATIPKLGLGYLASALRAAGHEVGILDCEQLGVTPAVRDRRLAEPWDLVGFQVFSNGLKAFRRDVARVKQANPDVVTLAGGPLASGLPEWVLSTHPALDYVLRGEAEESLVGLVAALGARTTVADIPGVVFREGGTVRSGPLPVSPDVDSLLPPAWDLVPPGAYPDAPVGGVAAGFPVGPIITSRGCPFPCPYCAARVIHGRGIRTRRPAAVLVDMETLVRQYGVKEIQVLDDCFGFDREQADSLLIAYARVPWRVPLSFPNGMRLDQVDADLLALLEAAGTHAVTFGIDFGSDRMLKRMNRRMTVADIRARLATVRQRSRLRVTGNFILGHFDDTRDGMMETARLARELPLDRAHFSAYVPIPGTPDWHRIQQRPNASELDLEGMDFNSFGLPHPQMSHRELTWLKRWAYAGFYARPDRLARMLGDVRSPRNFLHLLRKVLYHA